MLNEWTMDRWKYFDITHRDHILCNPTTVEKLDELIGLLRLERGASVLDIACGAGRFTRRMAELGARVAATDTSERFIDVAKARTRRHTDRIEYALVDATGLAEDSPEVLPGGARPADVVHGGAHLAGGAGLADARDRPRGARGDAAAVESPEGLGSPVGGAVGAESVEGPLSRGAGDD